MNSMRTHRIKFTDDLVGELALSRVFTESAAIPRSAEAVELDLGGVGAVDASGIVALVRLYSNLQRRSVAISACNARHGVERSLRTVGLSTLLNCETRRYAEPSTRPRPQIP